MSLSMMAPGRSGGDPARHRWRPEPGAVQLDGDLGSPYRIQLANRRETEQEQGRGMASATGRAGITLGAAMAFAMALAQPSGALAQDYSTIEEGTLLIGSDMTYPPYIYMDGGEPAGFEVE